MGATPLLLCRVFIVTDYTANHANDIERFGEQ
jgi:hypothetical protein